MTSTENLNRLAMKNKAAKVHQLSEIAALFERERIVEGQASQLKELKNNLLSQVELSPEDLKKLPKTFLKNEKKKRDQLLNRLDVCEQESAKQIDEIQKNKEIEVRELKKLDCRIERVQEKVKKQKLIIETAKDLIAVEECVRNA